MKNFLFVIIIFLSLISCGKKGDPEYKANKITENHENIIQWIIKIIIFILKILKQKN